jgi:hypothetical protein
MEHKIFIIGVVIILLVGGAAGFPAAASEASRAPSLGVPERAEVVPGWQQVNSNGFGAQQTGEVSALAAFTGYLYAGTHNPIDPEPLFDGAQIFRSPDGIIWTAVTDPGFGVGHDTAPPAILDLAVFNGRLYASTGRGNAAKIYRSVDGLNWAPVVNSGFGDPDTVNINALVDYNSFLYAGVTNQVSGAQIWRSFSGDSSSWTQVAPAVAGNAPASVTALAVFSNMLYAAVEFESDAPVQIWRSNGGLSWTALISDGFGDNDNTLTGGMAVFNGYLYVGVGNAASGAQLWRTNNPDDSTSWAQVITPAFGDANNQKVEMVYVFQNQLYASVKNTLTGIELWRSTDGTLWERANQDGFSDSHNSGSNRSNATTDFLGQLYVGTSNVVDGGELWRMEQQQQQQQRIYLPLILR